jgi:glycosyltransferase involved in cell wall biosynthesis
MSVSIWVLLYNTEKFIRKKLDSLLSQTHSNFELIISYNGSTDSTSKICQ